jgi:hypothetical protein
MDRLIKLLGITCLACVSLLGQQRNTVYQSFTTTLNATVTPTPTVLAPLVYTVSNNIGQISHSFSVTATPANNGTCIGLLNGLKAGILTSYDNISGIAPKQAITYQGNTKIYHAMGSYPYVTFNIWQVPSQATAGSGCRFAVSYSGSLVGTSLADRLVNTFNNIVATTTCTSVGIGSTTLLGAGEALTDRAIVGYTTRLISGAATRVSFYSDAGCTSGIIPPQVGVNDTVLPNAFNDSLGGTVPYTIPGGVASTGYSLYVRTDVGTVFLTLYTTPTN